MPTTKTMLGVGACAIAVVALCRRALRTPTPRDGRPQLTRQNAYRTLPGLRDDPPPSYSEAVRAPKEHIGGAPPRAEGDGAEDDDDRDGRKASALGELRYSEAKIERNFSNYSAWHHRAEHLPRAFEENQAARASRDGIQPGREEKAGAREKTSSRVPDPVLAREYAFVRQAFFTEPEDQAGWMYHRWLTAQTARRRGEDSAAAAAASAVFAGEADALAELCDLEPDCKWPVLTLARLRDLEGTEAGAVESARRFTQLARLDPTRRGFYCDCGGRA